LARDLAPAESKVHVRPVTAEQSKAMSCMPGSKPRTIPCSMLRDRAIWAP